MPVDPTKSKRILVIHGVETGTDEDQHQNEDIEKLIRTRLNGAPLEFETAMYRYENINDRALGRLHTVLSLFLTNILAQNTIDTTVDIVGDVVNCPAE